MPECAARACCTREIECPYRRHVQRLEGRESAVCDLLRAMTCAESEVCRVDRSACELCVDAFPSPAARLNPVIPSLLFQICDAEIRRNPSPERRATLLRLQAWAAQGINPPLPERVSLPGCDVVVWCSKHHKTVNTARALESALAQRGVVPVVHLVIDGSNDSDSLRSYQNHPQVIIHRDATSRCLFTSLHNLLPKMRTSFLAIQDPDTISHPDRLLAMISQMEERKGEIGGSALTIGTTVLNSEAPTNEYRRYIAPETLVFRRASLIDMGGFCHREFGSDVEIVVRAKREGRVVLVNPLSLVSRETPAPVSLTESESGYQGGSLHPRGIGFEMTHVACDVVLPFFDHPEYVHAAIESVIEQQQAEAIIHLVDDASPHGEQVFARWRGHRAVRMYQNSLNIGPFASFNNVSDYFETELAAVQDADDISTPTRLHLAGNLLRLSGSDFFGGGIEIFGDHDPETDPHIPQLRLSQYPHPGVQYFLENPTAVFSVAAFRRLGGYANFGERLRNRTGVDTELFARAYYSGIRFAITRDVVLRYRRHRDSATQNPMTGGNSTAAREARAERDRRIKVFQSAGCFDPRLFGAMRDFHGVTRPL